MIKCNLDGDACLDLLTVLRIISKVDQEQAWAICYEIGALVQRLSPSKCAPIESLSQVYLHQDGFVHEKTCSVLPSSTSTSTSSSPQPQVQQASDTIQGSPASLSSSRETDTDIDTTTNTTTSNTSSDSLKQIPPTPPITPELKELLQRRPALDESEMVASIGLALFWALDYGIPDDEERKLSINMEYLIYQSQSKLSLQELLDSCIKRLPIPTKLQADSHYRQVCKTLVSDTIELSMFLEKIYTASIVLGDITLEDCLNVDHRGLGINDWARLWMQVIRELRQRGCSLRGLWNISSLTYASSSLLLLQPAILLLPLLLL